jgi:hypothetical protein
MAEHLYPRAHKSKNMLSSFAHGRIVINDETHRLRFEGVLHHLPPGPTFSTTYFDLTLSTASAVARCGLLNCSCLSDISVADFVEFVDAAAAHTRARLLRNLIIIPARANERLKLYKLIHVRTPD